MLALFLYRGNLDFTYFGSHYFVLPWPGEWFESGNKIFQKLNEVHSIPLTKIPSSLLEVGKETKFYFVRKAGVQILSSPFFLIKPMPYCQTFALYLRLSKNRTKVFLKDTLFLLIDLLQALCGINREFFGIKMVILYSLHGNHCFKVKAYKSLNHSLYK